LSQLALAHGSHVLCEKPLCATVQDARQFIDLAAGSDRIVAVGYQWSFAEAIQKLKADIRAGVLGRPLRLKSYVFWPRGATYYQRNRWAGRLKTNDGAWVLDSPVNNATAHYLHNMFFVLGDQLDTSATPVSIEAELYRANDIENYDTAALRCRTDADVEILFYTSHALDENKGPSFDYEFEEAVVRYADRGAHLIATYRDGRQHDYGDPFADDSRKLWLTAEAIRHKGRVVCGPQTAAAHILAMNGAHESMPAITLFPTEVVRLTGELTWVDGLSAGLKACYDHNLLPAEMNFSWARAGSLIDLRDYHHFPRAVRLH
jgi:predicted dehydrogenase